MSAILLPVSTATSPLTSRLETWWETLSLNISGCGKSKFVWILFCSAFKKFVNFLQCFCFVIKAIKFQKNSLAKDSDKRRRLIGPVRHPRLETEPSALSAVPLMLSHHLSTVTWTHTIWRQSMPLECEASQSGTSKTGSGRGCQPDQEHTTWFRRKSYSAQAWWDKGEGPRWSESHLLLTVYHRTEIW